MFEGGKEVSLWKELTFLLKKGLTIFAIARLEKLFIRNTAFVD